MQIATFAPGTETAGKRITREGDAFILEGHGPVSAQDVMEHDRQGHLVWVNDGTRAWVGSLAQRASARTQAEAQAGRPVATFGPSSKLAGKTISLDNGQYRLEGHGPITAQDVLEYDRLGQISWAEAGLREQTRAAVSQDGVATPSDRGEAASAAAAVPPSLGLSSTQATRPEERGSDPKRVILYAVAGLAVVLIVAVAAVSVLRSSSADGADTSVTSPAPQWIEVMTLSGGSAPDDGTVEASSSAAFELSGSEQRLEYTVYAGARSVFVVAQIWVLSTGGPDSGHSDPVVQLREAGSNSIALYKDPGRYTLKVESTGCTWEVTLFEKR